MQRALLGVDVGTTNTKVIAFDLNGSEIAKLTRPTPTITPQPGWAEYDVDALWALICSLLRDLRHALPQDTECAAIAFTGMAEAGVALDRSGNVLSRAISWLDVRTVDELAAWETGVGAADTARITGLPLSTAAGILRLLWLRTNEPEIFSATHRWLNIPDYCAYRLCGAQATDYSLGSRMMTLDLSTRQWSDTLCSAVDLSPQMLGECVASGTALGVVQPQAAEQTGLPARLPVISGGHDHVCAALALGLTEPGDVLDSIGTAEAMLAPLREPLLDPKITAKGIAQGVHVVPDQFYAMSGLFYGGGSIDWIRSVLLSTAESDSGFEQLLADADAVAATEDNPYFLAHLRQANPPLFDPHSRAAFVGLTSDHTAAHMARAVVEGLASEYHRLFETVISSFGLSPQRLIATGGGTRVSLLLRLKAALAGTPIEIPQVTEATALGAALLAGLGSGVYTGLSDARERIKSASLLVEADSDLQELQQKRYGDVYVRLYDALQPVNKQITERLQ